MRPANDDDWLMADPTGILTKTGAKRTSASMQRSIFASEKEIYIKA